jgi:hypothetical protein
MEIPLFILNELIVNENEDLLSFARGSKISLKLDRAFRTSFLAGNQILFGTNGDD